MDGTSDSREDARMRPGDGADRTEADRSERPGLAEAADAASEIAVGLESLRGVFLVEAEELLSGIGERLRRLRSEPCDTDTLAEIAQVTGVGTETVKSRLRYATGKLRSALSGVRQAWR